MSHKPEIDHAAESEQHRLAAAHTAIEAIDSTYELVAITESTDARIEEAARLDQELFGSHLGLSEDDYRQTLQRGGMVFGHQAEGVFISQSVFVSTADRDAPTILERHLPEWLAYCDGSAVVQEHRGEGLQRELLQSREIVAKMIGKRAICAAVRDRNLASMRSMLREGYVILAAAPGLYGNEPEDDRVVMFKNMLAEAAFVPDDASTRELGQLAETPDQVDAEIAQGTERISLAVTSGRLSDPGHTRSVTSLIRHGYAGVRCVDVATGGSERSCKLEFVRLDALPESSARALRTYQETLQRLLDTAGQ